MGDIFKYIKDFYNRGISWPYLIVVVLLMAGIIYLNYWHQLEKKYAAGGTGWLRDFTGYYLLYLLPFATAFLLQPLFYKDCSYWQMAGFGVSFYWHPLFLLSG